MFLHTNMTASSLLQESSYWYHHILSQGDPRVADWPLMSSPWPTLYLTASYIVICMGAVKNNNKPVTLLVQPSLLVYNVFNIALNAYIAKELWETSRGYSWICQPVNYGTDENSVRVASALWWYYISKAIEFLDSMFFILRGKLSQLTFLHIYHHSSMFCLWWIGVKYVAGGSAVFGAMINACVHILMYSYYFIAALGPGYKRFLGWKRYLTLLQILQFVAAIVMGVNAIRVGCDFPLWMQYAMIAYMVTFLLLFRNFYVSAYSSTNPGGCSSGSAQKTRKTKKGESRAQNGLQRVR